MLCCVVLLLLLLCIVLVYCLFLAVCVLYHLTLCDWLYFVVAQLRVESETGRFRQFGQYSFERVYSYGVLRIIGNCGQGFHLLIMVTLFVRFMSIPFIVNICTNIYSCYFCCCYSLAYFVYILPSIWLLGSQLTITP